MFLDALALLSDAQALTVTALSTNTIDFGNTTPKRDPFDGEPMTLCFGVDVAADFTTADETYEFQAISSAAAALTTPTVLSRRAILATLLTAGTVHYLPIPPGSMLLRYFGANYVLGGTSPLLTVTTWLSPQSMIQRWKVYASGYTVS